MVDLNFEVGVRLQSTSVVNSTAGGIELISP